MSEVWALTQADAEGIHPLWWRRIPFAEHPAFEIYAHRRWAKGEGICDDKALKEWHRVGTVMRNLYRDDVHVDFLSSEVDEVVEAQ